ncbi:hypothetical protein [Salinivirga cyanobacteriivorans]
MKRKISTYTLIFLFTLFVGEIEAQKFDGHILDMPKEIFEGGGKIYVQDLTNEDDPNSNFGSNYAKALRNALNADRVAYGRLGKLYNPWLTTKIYEVVDSKSDADYVISGDYQVSSNSSESNKAVYIKETAEVSPQIPVCYYNYTISNSATVKGNLYLMAKGQDAAYKTLPFKQKKGKSKTKALEKPKVKSPQQYISNARKAAIKQYQYYFSPIIVEKKYRFKNLRGEDRKYNRELRKQEREIKDLADQGDIMTMGKMYKEIITHKLKDLEQGYLNLGMCYEIIGNYTKAKVYYEKSGNKGAIRDINKLIKERDIIAEMGVEIVEKGFK